MIDITTITIHDLKLVIFKSDYKMYKNLFLFNNLPEARKFIQHNFFRIETVFSTKYNNISNHIPTICQPYYFDRKIIDSHKLPKEVSFDIFYSLQENPFDFNIDTTEYSIIKTLVEAISFRIYKAKLTYATIQNI